ncbi:hypothetical protein [Stakelama tenebrarum]|uniref:Uncharacterized protein n=1 Tax=Stakelama tenebrarum TaxID=2711215 RepID=A0A6G6Y661_9SPHN|nr:hypothetical protein [Sphingosinithalassobacter tenebrarum]QIG80066.1 hypothetical protein G5C33_09925 [Sphingosinithalassobacter tenebrarum]
MAQAPGGAISGSGLRLNLLLLLSAFLTSLTAMISGERPLDSVQIEQPSQPVARAAAAVAPGIQTVRQSVRFAPAAMRAVPVIPRWTQSPLLPPLSQLTDRRLE